MSYSCKDYVNSKLSKEAYYKDRERFTKKIRQKLSVLQVEFNIKIKNLTSEEVRNKVLLKAMLRQLAIDCVNVRIKCSGDTLHEEALNREVDEYMRILIDDNGFFRR